MELGRKIELTNLPLNSSSASPAREAGAARSLVPPTPERPPIMPEDAAEIWKEGNAYLLKNLRWHREISDWRGWTPDLVEQLAADGMMATPLYSGRRNIAFAGRVSDLSKPWAVRLLVLH